MVSPESAVNELRELLSVNKGVVSASDIFTQKRIMELMFRILRQHGYKAFVQILERIVIE